MKGIWKYSSLLLPAEERNKLSLGEGNTPLIRSRQLGPRLGLKNLYFKLEMVSPSGSYKDRFAAAAVTDLLQKAKHFCFATSSGNTGASLAAYCAASNIKCFLAIVETAPVGKIQQMQVYGADIIIIKDFGKDFNVSERVMKELEALAGEYHSPVQISSYAYSPIGMTGVQTIAYEIAESPLSISNLHVFSPAGGGGLSLALTKGFKRWKETFPNFKIPPVHCVQPVGNNTIAGQLRNGSMKAKRIEKSTTTISGLQVPNILDGDELIELCREFGGKGYVVTDKLIYTCQRQMAIEEGIFCEPAGAVALAGLRKALDDQEINKKDHIVCLVTGHGFKDPVSAKRNGAYSPIKSLNADETFRYIRSKLNNN